jgi:hypothetical protein
MGFSVGSYAKIKEVDNKGNYTKAKIVISKKIKGSNPAQYVCSFSGWVTCVGNAHSKAPTAGQKIKITNCDVNNGYLDRDGTQKFNNSPQFTLYDYELDGQAPMPSGNGYTPSAYGAPNFANSSPSFEELPDSDGLPF